MQRRPEGEDDEQLCCELAPEELDDLDRLRRQRLEVLDDRGELGSQLVFDVLTPTRNGEWRSGRDR